MTDFFRHIYIVCTGASVVGGFFLALVFLRWKRKNKKISLVLSSLMIVFAISVTLNSYLNIFIPSAYPRLWSFPEPFMVLIGPLFYIYIQSLSGSFSFSKRAILHFLPFAFVGIGFLVFILNEGQYISDIRLAWNGIGLLWMAIYLHFWMYYFWNYRALTRFREKLKQSRSFIEDVYQSWIAHCLGMLLVGYTLLGVLFLLSHGPVIISINQILAIEFSLIIAAIGYRTLTQPEIFLQPLNSMPNSDPDREEKYKRSGLTAEAAKDELRKVEFFMKTEKPYLKPNLDLKSLAGMLHLSSHHLSQVINKGTHLNFYDFVNGYRVEEAKDRLSDSGNDHLAILSIAFEVGFNSKATFNRFFKKATLQTPSQFRNKTKR